MSNLRQQVAEIEGLRAQFLSREGIVSQDALRKALTPDADVRKQLEEAMKLISALTAANQKLREENDRLRLSNWVNERIIQIGIDKEQAS